jgi:hypothetical protein
MAEAPAIQRVVLPTAEGPAIQRVVLPHVTPEEHVVVPVPFPVVPAPVEVKKFNYVVCLSYKRPINDTNLSMSSVWQFSNDRKHKK